LQAVVDHDAEQGDSQDEHGECDQGLGR
jgi:hypothetical protein